MITSPNLASAPFHLSDEDIAWVESTLADMSVRQKVGQLLCLYLPRTDMKDWIRWLEESDIAPGAVMMTARSRDEARHDVHALQAWSRIPLLVSGNLESGASSLIEKTDAFATPMQVAATGDPHHAERLAVHCARAADEVGMNWAFAPVVDVTVNPHNPVTNTRAFGEHPETVATMAERYVRTLESHGIATCPKHFPGDGVDDRDQHLTTTNNDLTTEEWEATYLPVYQRVIAAGARSMMMAHIRQPALSRQLSPGLGAADILPGSLSAELIQGVLRGRLGFNGLVTTDNTAMIGMTALLPRETALPLAVNAGNDVILGNIDVAEDIDILHAAARDGRIPAERLDDAVRRILATKASLRLHRPSDRPTSWQIDEAEEETWRRELAEASVTLVKDTQSLLPLTSERFPRVLVYALGAGATFYDPTPSFAGRFADGLRSRGMSVDLQQIPGEGRTPLSASRLHQSYDLCVYFADVRFIGNSNTLRVHWTPWQGPDAPRHVASLPTLLVSVASPYLLEDMPMVRTAVNGYTPTAATVDAVLAALFGETDFRGVSPVDAFAGRWDARL